MEDYASATFLELSEPILKKNFEDMEFNEVNDVIEMYNILQYLDNKMYLKKWDDEFISTFDGKKNTIKEVIGRYFNGIEENNFINIAQNIINRYIDDFIYLCSKNNVFSKINDEIAQELVNLENFNLSNLLKSKIFVQTFTELTKCLILNDFESITLFIKNDNKKKYFFPDNLRENEKEHLVLEYIKSKEPNLNLLETISRYSGNNLNLRDSTKYKAKKRYHERKDDILNSNSSLETNNLGKFEFGIGYKKDLPDSQIFEYDKENQIVYFNANKIYDLLDYEGILQTLIYIFAIVDKDMNISGLLKNNAKNTLIDILANYSNNDFKFDLEFQMFNSYQELILRSYLIILEENDMKIEKFIQWFFQVYLKQKFGIENFKYQKPSDGTTYIEKINFLSSQLDIVVKQYNLLCEYREIETGLLNFTSKSPLFSEIESFVDKKYVYFKSTFVKNISYELFNEQSNLNTLFYNGSLNFTKEIFQGTIIYENLKNAKKEMIDKLINKDILFIGEKSILEFTNPVKILVYKYIYMNSFIPYYHMPKRFRNEIDNELYEKHFSSERSLLAKPEVDFFNYYLNKKFSNGLDIRNKYVHGTIEEDNTQSFNDYVKFIRCFLLMMIKIDDDLSIHFNLNTK